MLVELEGVRCQFGNQVVLDDINLRIESGEWLGVVGPSGAGKTTLLRLILGAVRPASGRVVMRDPRAGGARRVRTAYVPQVETVDWTFPVTVEQVVLMGRCLETHMWPWPAKEDRRVAGRLLERLGLSGFAHNHIAGLSGGQQQRVFLARALAHNPALLVLDEPTSALDAATCAGVMGLLAELNQEGMTILLATHELAGVAGRLPRVVSVNKRILADGPPAAVLTPAFLGLTLAD